MTIPSYERSFEFKYPLKAKEWHPTKNGELKPSQFTSGSNKIAWWLCPNKCEFGCLHEYEQKINKRSVGQGCIYCLTAPKKICYHQSLEFKYPEHAKEWHPTKNGDLKPSQITCHNNKKVWWLCPNTCEFGCLHEYEQIVSDKTKGIGCPFCSLNRTKSCYHQSFEFNCPELCLEIHPTENKNLILSQITCGSEIKLTWICSKKHVYVASVKFRKRGGGCPICKNKTEQKMYEALKPIYPTLITQFKQEWCKNIAHLPFDFCIPEHNIIIELDGAQHFIQVSNWKCPEDTFENDLFKEKCANDNGYSVIRILQEDVFGDKYDWLSKLQTEIENIIKDDTIIHNIYMCENGEYDKFMIE